MASLDSSKTFDFVIVGSGPAGSALASRLARSIKAPRVLLLEAGAAKVDDKALLLAERYSTLLTYPDYNWGYKTAPQANLNGRQVDYSRGRGLGGSTRINFAAYTIGPKGDYDHWADLVEDDFFNWANSRRRFNKIEAYNTKVNPEYKDYVDLGKAEHGTGGPLTISFPEIFERGVTNFNDVIVSCGIPRNLDINSGDPIGIGVVAATGTKGLRSTALSYLKDPPSNLTIVADAQVTQIAFDGKRAIGAKVGDKLYRATKEVIISAGALDTPKLLLLSGVGPKEELTKHNIECVHELPVGRNLRDHWFFPLNLQLKQGGDDRPPLADPEFVASARAQFEKDGTGPLAVLYNLQQMGWLRPSEALEQSQEFKTLPAEEKEHLRHSTVPTWEICTHSPPLHPDALPDKSYLSVICIGMLPQSHGTVTLASADPKDAPVCDPNLFSHPFDRRNAIEACRITYDILTSPLLAEDTESIFNAPKSMSDEDIIEYAKETTNTTWHMSCTAKMGRDDDPKAVVDKRFRVRGLEGLRVADMSVTPFAPNCHTVAVAYQIGEMAAERLIEEYGLA